MSERSRRRRPLSPEERQLWDLLAKTVAPLSTHMRQIGADLASSREPELEPERPPPFADRPAGTIKAKVVTVPRAIPDDDALEALWLKGISGSGKEPTPPSRATVMGLPLLEHGASPGVDRRTADRFRKGRMIVEKRLDLHGMTQEQAHGSLNRFLEHSASTGIRCVLVITGKGMRGEGILRRMVPRWLNDARLRPLILSFSHAQIPDGGDGALYILLKRRRESV
jgi:DNA-nicking Smr family endonuclease